jgi:nucleotide-binding universal stress UspA family protein
MTVQPEIFVERKHHMYRTILVPLDGSQRAEAILPHVVEVAKRFAAEVILLQVVEPTVISPGVPVAILLADDVNEHTAAAQAYLAGIQDQLRQQGIHARSLVPNGNVVDQIIAAANEEQADLVAIASHGRGGLAQLFYGSVASALLQHSNQPLLMVRSRAGE